MGTKLSLIQNHGAVLKGKLETTGLILILWIIIMELDTQIPYIIAMVSYSLYLLEIEKLTYNSFIMCFQFKIHKL